MYSIIRVYTFQFYIVRLKAKVRCKHLVSKKLFQFYIVRLKAEEFAYLHDSHPVSILYSSIKRK